MDTQSVLFSFDPYVVNYPMLWPFWWERWQHLGCAMAIESHLRIARLWGRRHGRRRGRRCRCGRRSRLFQDVPGAKCPFFSTFSCSRLLLDLQSNWEIRILPWSFSAIYNICMRPQWGATFLGDPVPLCILKTAQSWSGSINSLLLMYLLWIGECPDDLLLNGRIFDKYPRSHHIWIWGWRVSGWDTHWANIWPLRETSSGIPSQSLSMGPITTPRRLLLFSVCVCVNHKHFSRLNCTGYFAYVKHILLHYCILYHIISYYIIYIILDFVLS